MLELVRSQKAELPMVAGAEELIMSASDIISSEINRRKKAEQKDIFDNKCQLDYHR